MNVKKMLLALILCPLILLSLPIQAKADGPRPYLLTAELPSGSTASIRGYQESYASNLYLSLADLSRVLSGTAKQFSIRRENDTYYIENGENPRLTTDAATNNGPFIAYLNTYRNKLVVDDREKRIYTYDTGSDLYMSLTDIMLLFDFTVEQQNSERIRLLPDTPFAPSPEALDAAGYFDTFSAVLLGDTYNGKLIYASNADSPVAIASISKLMTYVLIREAMDAGTLHADDAIVISSDASALSYSADGTIGMVTGYVVPLQELIDAMLVASSNESCLAIAEHIAGSEQAFVNRMNARAAEMGLYTAKFYTPHGLPKYSREPFPIKNQNTMSAKDLFDLSAYILQTYPDITDVTSQQYEHLSTMSFTTANSNPLLFNMEGITGLKTGSTNKAGSCVAVSMPMDCGGITHNIVAIVLGAETADVRGQCAQLLLEYARAHYTGN